MAFTALSHVAADDAVPKGLSPREYNVFVAAANQSRITMIDPDLLAAVGSIDLGFDVKQFVVSARLKVVAASDDQLRELRIYDLATDQIRSIALPFAPTRLIRAPDDTRLAALDTQHGRLAVIDLERNGIVETSPIDGTLEDVLFSTDGGALYLAGKDRRGVTVLDIDRGSIGELDGTSTAAFTGLSRSPNGRDGFGKRLGSDEIEEFDLRRQKLAGHLDATPDTTFAFVTGTGRFILLPDNRRRELRIATTDPLEIVATLQGSPTMDAAYSAWFDTLAYVTSPSEHRLLVYDLDHLSALGEVRLGGTPGSALVGPGGDKLFVPLVDAKAVQVIDTGNQRIAAHISLDANPIAIVLASAYGLCH